MSTNDPIVQAVVWARTKGLRLGQSTWGVRHDARWVPTGGPICPLAALLMKEQPPLVMAPWNALWNAVTSSDVLATAAAWLGVSLAYVNGLTIGWDYASQAGCQVNYMEDYATAECVAGYVRGIQLRHEVGRG